MKFGDEWFSGDYFSTPITKGKFSVYYYSYLRNEWWIQVLWLYKPIFGLCTASYIFGAIFADYIVEYFSAFVEIAVLLY